MSEERLLQPEERKEDDDAELKLRPSSLKEYIGQEDMKRNLSIFITASNKRNEALDHVLIYGPPGLGKQHLLMLLLMKKKQISRLQVDLLLKKQVI